MNCDFSVCDEDCEKCAHNILKDISSDYEEHKYFCMLCNEFLNSKRKPCGLEKGKFYRARYIVVSSKKSKSKKEKGNVRER